MSKTASTFVAQAEKWLGVKEGSKTHKEMIEIYNKHRPLAHGYEMGVNDAWCVMFVSAVSIKLGFTSIIPTDCRCSSMIEKFKKLGVWKENENRVPNVGDICFYDWEDSGKGDNKGVPNHVGIVSNVSGNSFTVIEGNYSNKVKKRVMEVNAKYLRGFAVPKYDSEVLKDSEVANGSEGYTSYVVKKGDTLGRLAKRFGTTREEILKLNSDKIKNPNLIVIGWVLKIPSK